MLRRTLARRADSYGSTQRGLLAVLKQQRSAVALDVELQRMFRRRDLDSTTLSALLAGCRRENMWRQGVVAVGAARRERLPLLDSWYDDVLHAAPTLPQRAEAT